MSELTGLYALWLREFKVFLREKSRIVSSLVQPLLWLVVFGGGLGSAISLGGIGVNYQTFIYPGILAMTALFGSLFFGLYLILDKRVDFMKEVLVAPLRRITMFFGKVLGGATDGLIQSVILIALGTFFGIHYTAFKVAMTLFFMALLIISMVSIGLALGSVMESPEGFGLVGTFLIFPLFFLSGALYPIKSLPAWLGLFVVINPLTYVVDGLRTVLLGISTFGLGIDIAVAIGFAVATVIIGGYLFGKMKI